MNTIQLFFEPFFNRWNQRLSWLLNSNLYEFLFGLTVFIGPIAQFPQLLKAITATSVEGISVETYVLLAYNFSILTLYGIKQQDWRIFLAMIVGLIEFMLIVIITMIRGGSFLGFSL